MSTDTDVEQPNRSRPTRVKSNDTEIDEVKKMIQVQCPINRIKSASLDPNGPDGKEPNAAGEQHRTYRTRKHSLIATDPVDNVPFCHFTCRSPVVAYPKRSYLVIFIQNLIKLYLCTGFPPEAGKGILYMNFSPACSNRTCPCKNLKRCPAVTPAVTGDKQTTSSI